MKLFVVFQQAIYRHSCIGIFSTDIIAIDAAISAAKTDVDDHHIYQVIEYELDKALPLKVEEFGYGAFCDENLPIFTTNKKQAEA